MIFQRNEFFTQKAKKLKLPYNFLQNPKFSKFSKKNLQHVVEPCLDIRHAKFQVDMSIFAKHIAQKPYPLMTSFFHIAILSISRHRTETEELFWNPEIKLVQKHPLVIRKKDNSKI